MTSLVNDGNPSSAFRAFRLCYEWLIHGKTVVNTKRKCPDIEKSLEVKDAQVCCNGGREVRGYASQANVLHKSSRDVEKVDRSKASAVRCVEGRARHVAVQLGLHILNHCHTQPQLP